MKDSSFPSPKEKIEELGQCVDRPRHALLGYIAGRSDGRTDVLLFSFE